MIKTVVLYYHSIAPRKKADWPRKYLTHELDIFEAALKYLKKKNYRVISLEEAHAANWQFKERTACLTFDDGFADFYIYVYPLLEKYQMPGTVFVSTDFVEDYRPGVLPTLHDHWEGKKSLNELEYWGYLNWEEMRLMEKTPWVKVESHTATHMKYPFKEALKDIHHPGANSLYPIGFFHPEAKTRFIRDSEVEKMLPYGYPFFEEKSAVVTPIHFPNSSLVDEILALFSNQDWQAFDKERGLAKANEILKTYKKNGNVFEKVESEEEMQSRLKVEIVESKAILEHQLSRKLKFLCWPHGDNNVRSHNMAMEAGFVATTLGSKVETDDWSERIPPRFSNNRFKNSTKLGLLKMDIKIKQYQESAAGSAIAKLYQSFR